MLRSPRLGANDGVGPATKLKSVSVQGRWEPGRREPGWLRPCVRRGSRRLRSFSGPLREPDLHERAWPIRRPRPGAALAEFRRYTGGATVGVYAVEDDGSARLRAGDDGLPAHVEADHSVMVRLRADREALHDDLPATVGAALVLPMTLRTEVRGVVLIGDKPSGEDYRPDEREALAGAAQRIGMDLHALEIDRLEAEVRRLAVPRPARARSRRVAAS